MLHALVVLFEPLTWLVMLEPPPLLLHVSDCASHMEG
jgi:hypothetical protein